MKKEEKDLYTIRKEILEEGIILEREEKSKSFKDIKN